MFITENDRLLSLLLQTLRDTITPALSSANAQALSGILQAVTTDLLKRERTTPALLAGANARGRELAAQMSALLAGADGERSAPLASASDAMAFADLLYEHTRLTGELTVLSERLAALRTRSQQAKSQTRISDLLSQAAHWELSYYAEQQRPLEPEPAPPSVAAGPLTVETLLPFVRRHHPEGAGVEITSFAAIPGGFGKQTSRFTLRDARGCEQVLIARKSDPHPMLEHAGFIIENEFHLVAAVSATGYPAPKPLWLGTGVAGVDASFYVMECMPGKIRGSFLGGLGEGQSADAIKAMLTDVATQLGRLHAYPLQRFADYINQHDDPALLGETVESCCRRQIEQWSQYARRQQLSSPFLLYLIDWLREHVPRDARRPVLLHGDFNIHNLLVENDRVSGVLDWECAMFGAPETDLAYIQPHISQTITWDDFLAAYHAAGGRELDIASMPFHLAFSSLRQNIAMINATRNLQTGANDDIRYAMVELGFGARFMELALAGTQGLRNQD